MALKLMDPINKMPFFQANQVLTYNHLNELAAYLYQQERYTRNKLIGSGIVCGLSFSWKAIAAGNAEVLIDDGCAITSAGYLIVFKQPVDNAGALVPYTHRRNFTRLKEFEPFKTVIGGANPTIYELITKDVFDSETDPSKSLLKDANKTDRVLILLYDIEALNIAKCLDESCDDKGKIYQYTPRPLLVPVEYIDLILNAAPPLPFNTEPGRGAKGKESQLFETDYMFLKNLFKGSNLQAVTTPADLVALFKNPCLDIELPGFVGRIDNLITKYPWIFNTQFNCMKSEVAALNVQTLGALFQTQVQTFRNNAANDIYMQYLYDFFRDVVDAYNELYSSVTDMVGECGGNEFIHPFHVMLGLPLTNDTLACYQEEKYNEHNFKYRHYFVPSPVMDGQFMLYEKVQSQFKRLVRIIANFSTPTANDVIIKVTPSKDYNWALGERALPYFYLQAAIENIRRVWNYDATRRNKISRIKGYKLPFTQDQLLDEDTSKNDFYRIEGHIGSNVIAAEATIDAFRNIYNLPFSVTSVSIQTTTNTIHCTFPDLEEEYSYYRDRVLGYLREIERWLSFINTSTNVPELDAFFKQFKEAIHVMLELLRKFRCLDKFPYIEYKKAYVKIWEAIFELYTIILNKNNGGANANQVLNTVQNIFNIVFFRPIYRIWFMYQYRITVITQNQVTSLKSLATKTTGLEHLAGVRRGETFLLVSDTSKGDIVVADFNLPDLLGCSCDCKATPCNEENDKIPAVSPLEKPIIMVVDYSYKQEKALIKNKAFFEPNNNLYILELDSMGFYKANSDIDPDVKLIDDAKKIPFTDLKASWENEKLVLRYPVNDNVEKDGFYKLQYFLTGNFEGAMVQGFIYLYVIGRLRGDKKFNFDVAVAEEIKVNTYPYDKEALKKTKPGMKFEGETKTRTIGGEKVKVYTTPNGNELGIYKDTAGLSYIKVIKAKTPGVEEVPFILEAGGASSKGSVSINVVDKKDKLENDTITGIIKGEDGTPLKDVTVRTTTNKEVVTNEKGEYTLTGLKAGEVIIVEKKGFRGTNIQVNSTTNPEIKMEKAPLIDIKGLEDIKLPGNLGSFAEGININAIRNLMK